MRNFVKRAGALVAVAPAFIGSAVHAAVPAGVTTALEDMGEDSITIATVVLVAIIALAAFKFMRRGIS